MKNRLALIGIFLLLLYFISCPQDAFAASCSGILLWFEQILPALLPYSILSNIILASGLFTPTGNSSSDQSAVVGNSSSYRASADNNRQAQLAISDTWRFRLPITPAELFVMICGFAFGFPIGSKLAADLCAKGIISRDRAQLLAAFTNNMSPAFVCNYVLTYSLNRSDLQLQTFLLLYGIPLIYGLLGLTLPVILSKLKYKNSISKKHSGNKTPYKRSRKSGYKTTDSRIQSSVDHTASSRTRSCSTSGSENRTPASRFHIDMQIVDTGITQSFETLIRLCGYIVIFSILAHIIWQFSFAGKATQILLTGVLEVTNGIGTLPESGLPEQVRYLLALGFLSFGGLSGIVQTGSMIKPADLSLRNYCRDKVIITILVLTATSIYVSLSGIIFP